MTKVGLKEKTGIKGRYRFRTYQAGTKKLLRTSDWVENLVVTGVNHGTNLILQRLIGEKDFDIEVTSAAIGTGTTVPQASDTDLATPVLDGILRATQEIVGNTAVLQFFIADAELPNGTYSEFGLKCGEQLFARSLIQPTYTKSSAEDTTVEYELTVTAA